MLVQVTQIAQTIMNIFSVLAAQAKKAGTAGQASSDLDTKHACAADVELLSEDISLPDRRLTGAGNQGKSYYTDEGDSEGSVDDPI